MTTADRIPTLRRRLAGLVDWSLPLETRAHPFLHGCRRLNASFFIKRDDETGLAGGKIRKYAALLPFIRRHGFHEVVVVGGAYANHAAALTAFLRGQQVPVKLFLRGAPEEVRPVGNQFLLQLLTTPDDIIWTPRADWPAVLERAHAYAETRRAEGYKVLVTPEGAAMAPVAPGLCTLLLDILRNEDVLGLTFDHVALDAGTGITAAVTLVLSEYLLLHKTYHILLAAGTAETFAEQVTACRAHLEALLEVKIDPPQNFHTYDPPAPFGRVTPDDLAVIRRAALTEGLLLDPIYTAKLYAFVEQNLARQPITGHVLMVHSGGQPALWGYADALTSRP